MRARRARIFALCLLLLTPSAVRGQGSPGGGSDPVQRFELRVERNGEAREGLAVAAGIAVPATPPGARFSLQHRGEPLAANFTITGRHPDGSPGFLLLEFQDPGRDAVELLVDPSGERGSSAQTIAWRAWSDVERELPALPLVAELEGAEGSHVRVALEPIALQTRALSDIVHYRARIPDSDGGELATVEAWVTRYSFAPDSRSVELVLRNDALDDAHGALRFLDLVVWVDDPQWSRIGAAWSRAKQTRIERTRDGARLRLFGGIDGESPWLGDLQGSVWRVMLGTRALERDRWLALLRWCEHPSLLVGEPRAQARTGWYGSIWGGPFGFEPGPEYDQRHLARMGWGWEEGWSGARGDTKYSGSSGSERVGPHHEGALRFVQGGNRAYFDHLLETAMQQALRPFPREFRAEEHPGVWLWDGRPRARSGAGLLGRDAPRALADEWRHPDDFEWLAEWHGWNGFDWEHLTLDLWLELATRLGSPWAARELAAVGEALSTYEVVQRGAPFGNSRSFGWTLRALAQLHALTGEQRWLDAGARMVTAALAAIEDLGTSEGAWLHSIAPDPRGLAEHSFEYPWHLAVAVWGLDAYLRREPPGAEPARELLQRLCDTLAGPCFDRESGLFKFAVAPEAPGFHRLAGEQGTLEWIPGALLAAREHVPEERSRIWMESALRHGDNLWQRRSFEESSATWVWWQPVVAARTRGFELDER